MIIALIVGGYIFGALMTAKILYRIDPDYINDPGSDPIGVFVAVLWPLALVGVIFWGIGLAALWLIKLNFSEVWATWKAKRGTKKIHDDLETSESQ